MENKYGVKIYPIKAVYRNILSPELSVERDCIFIQIPNHLKGIDERIVVNQILNKMYEKITEKELEKIFEEVRLMMNIAPEDFRIERIDGVMASCKDGVITINPEIAKYNREVFRYLVIHEFCHLRYKAHTKSFYNLLSQYCSNYDTIATVLNSWKY